MSRLIRRATCLITLAVSVAAFHVPAAGAAGASRIVGSIEVSTEGGLGRIDVRGDVAAVLQRDEGIVSLVDVSDPARMKVLGRFDDNARRSLDGDVAFSNDGRWIFYARQTVQFSLDGLHVIDVSDPAAPVRRSYQLGGGALRVESYHDGTDEWVVLMDAITGMVIYRFEPTSGVLVPVHISPLPQLKVGGPASAGIVIAKDPVLDKPLLYASTGKTGVEIFDFSDPANPELLGSWNEIGLAEIEVATSGKRRVIYGASEYWFDKQQEPVVVVLDATKLDRIKRTGVYSAGVPADDRLRVQGMTLSGTTLYVAHSELGLAAFGRPGPVRWLVPTKGQRNDGANVPVGEGAFAYDVEHSRGSLYVTDAATGRLTVVRPPR